MTRTHTISGFEVDRSTLVVGALVANTMVLLMAVYYALSPDDLIGPIPVVVPLVWISVSVLVFARTRIPATTDRRRQLGLAIGAAYFGLLAYFGGIWGAPIQAIPMGVDLTLVGAPPGWTPRLALNSPLIYVNLLPWKLAGYLALAYLVYATVLDAAGSAVSGVLGLLSCVSCTWPVIATIASSVLGGTAAVTAVAYNQSYLLSTLVFLVTVALLYWRPGWR
jgi:hypothetical protein